jgi:hypothetical protein
MLNLRIPHCLNKNNNFKSIRGCLPGSDGPVKTTSFLTIDTVVPKMGSPDIVIGNELSKMEIYLKDMVLFLK